ncbi:hypothetical protein F0562_015393 [Nyssa sinensis]|uniref:Uncharacterized protein n=1 Tax=Nyssa sinensis TaxID=561372 RepID=A0A5J4ZIM3_9ASTE|nr:hypothetical protein F0562_015393 [Nyssa sinensis]
MGQNRFVRSQGNGGQNGSMLHKLLQYRNSSVVDDNEEELPYPQLDKTAFFITPVSKIVLSQELHHN